MADAKGGHPVRGLLAGQAPSVKRQKDGERRRKQVPRTSHAAWTPPVGRVDPVSLLEAQNVTRLADLVPIRFGRMLDSPFAFFRGAAAVMTADLAATPNIDVEVQLCGDAHLANFGTYASPERHLVFDLNDFDETAPGPWEWDLKRLAASVVLAARYRGFAAATGHDLARRVGLSYRQALFTFAGMSTLDLWYWHIDVDRSMAAVEPTLATKHDQKAYQRTKKLVDKAHNHDTLQALSKLTEIRDGRRRIVDQPPLLVPMPDGNPGELAPVFQAYLDTLPPDRRVLVERFGFVEGARKVVGVGSVGTRCWILLFEGTGDNDALFLQVKEAQASVIEPHWRPSRYSNHAERVVLGQRLMQAETDIFLGWTRESHTNVDYYMRQLRDMKGSVDLENIKARELGEYAELCGLVLARAHARAGDPGTIAGYLGSTGVFDQALADFAVAYADQSEQDHARLEKAAKKGRIAVERGV